jgi:hypothetical protein
MSIEEQMSIDDIQDHITQKLEKTTVADVIK